MVASLPSMLICKQAEATLTTTVATPSWRVNSYALVRPSRRHDRTLDEQARCSDGSGQAGGGPFAQAEMQPHLHLAGPLVGWR